MKRHWSPAFSLALVLMLIISFLPGQALPAYAVSPDIVISQVYGGGGNSGAVYTNDFVELLTEGTTTISLAGWSIQYASATGSGNFGANSGQLTPLSGSVNPGQYILVEEAAGSTPVAALPPPDITDSTPINMSGSGGKVALVTSGTSLGCNGGSAPCSPEQLALIKDLVGWDGANFYEGASAAPGTGNSTAVLRASGGCTDTDDNSADFTAGAPDPHNSASPLHSCSGPTNPSGTGSANPSTLFVGDPVLLTVAVTPGANPTSTGLAVSCDLSSIGGSGTQALYDDGTNDDASAGDNTFSYSTSVGNDTTAGDKSLPCTITDDQSRTGSASIALTVLEIIPIGTVNGPVGDTDNGTTHVSPYVGQTVTVQGVIYERTLQAISNSANTYKGFFIQNTAATADGDANTSDGLFVFMNTFPDLIGGYVPQVGDEVVISGKISEYFNMTELGSASLVKPVVRTGVDIDAEVAPVEANPPASLDRCQPLLGAPAGHAHPGAAEQHRPWRAQCLQPRGCRDMACTARQHDRAAPRSVHTPRLPGCPPPRRQLRSRELGWQRLSHADRQPGHQVLRKQRAGADRPGAHI